MRLLLFSLWVVLESSISVCIGQEVVHLQQLACRSQCVDLVQIKVKFFFHQPLKFQYRFGRRSGEPHRVRFSDRLSNRINLITAT